MRFTAEHVLTPVAKLAERRTHAQSTSPCGSDSTLIPFRELVGGTTRQCQ